MDRVHRFVTGWVALAVVPVLALGACSKASGTPPADAVITTKDGDVSMHVQVADTGEARSRGLQGVTELGADEGMAFLFDEPVRTSFWMKDTPLPLSIAFWREDGKIVAIRDMEPCQDDPCPTYRPHDDYVGALEANRGYFDRHGVEVGDHVAIVR
jgi:uncharacterized membrane protein (UPF0127 family)